MKKTKQPTVKQNNEQKARVLRLKGLIDINKLADEIGCTPRLIYYVFNGKRSDNMGIFAKADAMIKETIES